MKANELMLGDWVNLKNGKVIMPCRITVIGHATQDRNEIGTTVCVDLSKEFPTCIFDMDVITPIPLTPEILEKTGFLAFQMDFSRCLWNVYEITNVLHVAICGEKMIFGYYHGDKDGNDTIEPLFDIHYVHQFQHALKLCGIDKTIEL